ncbi:unnamed protein product [Brachionus calyciflorus]|uniref:MYND-type domain-containing protein n=1 Tax=Brachionus calyciflorus TaxID=104777 RepID=A0A814KBH8_9BILA|nr:unnamed protein product [Brachionus calyciflorus]
MAEEIITSVPFVYCLKYAKKRIFCDFCFKKIIRACHCPVCGTMHYCNTTCEKNDTIHRFECDHFLKASGDYNLKKYLEDDVLRLFLRTLIKTNNVSQNRNFYQSMAKKYENEIRMLMGTEFMSSINLDLMVPNFDKMMANKIEIKNEKEAIGFGIYLQNSFDSLENASNNFDGIRIIYKRSLFPALRFSESATNDSHIKIAIRIANRYLESRNVRNFYQEKIKVKSEVLKQKISEVKIVYEEQQKDFLAWTDRHVDNRIYINRKLEKRLEAISYLKDISSQKEKEIITVFIGFLLIHEFANLLYRWNGNLHSTENKDVGYKLENFIFDGNIRVIISTKSKWNEDSRYLGIGIRDTSQSRKIQFLSYDYIKEIFTDNLPFGSYFSPKFEVKEFGDDVFALRESDEFETNSDIEENLDDIFDDYEDAYNIQTCGT